MTVDERNLIIDECAAYLEGRAESLERNGNPYGAYEARNCALALRRMTEQREAAA